MNKETKFNSEMTQSLRKVLREANEMSKKYDKDPHIILKVIGTELIKIADQQQKDYISKLQAMETLRVVTELENNKE